jgi:hypothetical protein
LLAVLLVLTSVACDPLKPGLKRNKDTSSVSVAIDPTTLGDLADQMQTLQVRIFRVENDQRGAAEGEAQRFPIERQRQEYTVRGITLGMKEFEVAILDTNDFALGTGKVRVLVQPGKNRTEPLVIRLTEVVQPQAHVPMELKLSGAGAALVQSASVHWQSVTGSGDVALTLVPAPNAGAVGYAQDVKPILEANCVPCHREGNALRKLKLDRFPFVSTYILDRDALLAEVIARIQDVDAPMPQDGNLEQPLIDKLLAWQAGGFLADAPAAGEVVFKGVIENQRVADLVAADLTLSGTDGARLLQKDLEPYLVEEGATFNVSLTVDLEDPSVEIPIVVER